ncbi:MAG: helix-turn-helix transcriptional regulator [Myxococcales bacterium]|nr:helix-turn-helix transcriptional regulator [Polyangiaceae bacterium]MDW8248454.1 helix-turn-helix transcriptional regulator [Myxococcales bacterium]
MKSLFKIIAPSLEVGLAILPGAMREDQKSSPFEQLITLLYDAVLEGDFSPFQELLKQSLGASAAGLTIDHVDPQSSHLLWHGLPLDCVADYSARYFLLDPWRAANERAPVGEPQVSDQLVDRRTFERSEFGGSFCPRYGVIDFLDILLERSEQQRVVLGATFTEAPRDPSANIELLRRLAPHVQRAVKLFQRMVVTQARVRTLEEAVAICGTGLALLDHRGAVLFQSREAQRCLQAQDGLSLDTKGYLCPGREVGHGLASLQKGTPGIVRIRRPSGRASYLLIFAPAGPRSRLLLEDIPWAIVYIIDPEREMPDLGDLLSTAFGLTRTEAKVAIAIASGHSAREVAEQHKVTHATVRTQLLAIYSKTGVSRQSALARLIHNLDLSLPFKSP